MISLAQMLAQAQVLLIEPGTEDPALLRFNPVFIQRNRVTTIQGQPKVKRENEPMRDKNGGHLYRFDEQGRTIYRNNSFGNPGSGRDTASIIYQYDGAGRPTSELHNDLNGHYVLDRELDDAGRIVREVYARVENLGTDRYHLVPGETHRDQRRTVHPPRAERYGGIDDLLEQPQPALSRTDPEPRPMGLPPDHRGPLHRQWPLRDDHVPIRRERQARGTHPSSPTGHGPRPPSTSGSTTPWAT
jgi:hypothetical protein